MSSRSAKPSGFLSFLHAVSPSVGEVEGLILLSPPFSPLILSPTLFFSFIFISWRLITFQYGSGFCHTLT